MTEKATNLSEKQKGTRCRFCTGCGRCFAAQGMRTVYDFRGDDFLKRKHPEQGRGNTALVCVDIGTTTIAMQLREKNTGDVLQTYTCLNPQRSYGSDVLSRIDAAGEEAVRAAMQNSICRALDDGVGFLKKEAVKQGVTIERMGLAANTTMLHLLFGYDVSGLGRAPFSPQTIQAEERELCGLKTSVLPGASAFIGADVVAGVLALRMQEREEITLLLDLGTNGEMVLGNRRRLIGASTAAGPAFEGNAENHGADLMALCAKLLEEGVVDETGLLAESYFTEGITIGGVKLTQGYIRSLQMAKAAICCGIRILCEKYGIACDEISRIFLAGGMGYYLDGGAAARLGLIPAALTDKILAVGNSALEGAFRYAVGEAGSRRPDIEVYNLAKEPLFAESYIESMNFDPCRTERI